MRSLALPVFLVCAAVAVATTGYEGPNMVPQAEAHEPEPEAMPEAWKAAHGGVPQGYRAHAGESVHFDPAAAPGDLPGSWVKSGRRQHPLRHVLREDYDDDEDWQQYWEMHHAATAAHKASMYAATPTAQPSEDFGAHEAGHEDDFGTGPLAHALNAIYRRYDDFEKRNKLPLLNEEGTSTSTASPQAITTTSKKSSTQASHKSTSKKAGAPSKTPQPAPTYGGWGFHW